MYSFTACIFLYLSRARGSAKLAPPPPALQRLSINSIELPFMLPELLLSLDDEEIFLPSSIFFFCVNVIPLTLPLGSGSHSRVFLS
jgi:hypothetical protein